MQVMALLPLSALWTFEQVSGADERKESIADRTGSVLDVMRNWDKLHQPHFQPLLDATMATDALAMVAEAPDRFFPFNYR